MDYIQLLENLNEEFEGVIEVNSNNIPVMVYYIENDEEKEIELINTHSFKIQENL
jgi:hypothetical protein